MYLSADQLAESMIWQGGILSISALSHQAVCLALVPFGALDSTSIGVDRAGNSILKIYSASVGNSQPVVFPFLACGKSWLE